MKYGFVLPGGTALQQLELAVIANQCGWDGVFVWEAAYGVDAWTLLAAMATQTKHIRLGTMLTPLPWRRPWKVASQVATLDQLSNGRAQITIGLGAVSTELGNTGEELDRRTRAEMMDEGIDILHNLWSGEMQHRGQHYEVDLAARADLGRVAQPVQPRIPIWVVGAWPRMKSMRRVLRCDGVLIEIHDGPEYREMTHADVSDVRAWLNDNGASPDFDIVVEGETQAGDSDAVRAWADAGATWWVESRWELPHESDERMQEVRERLLAGPPRID